jgi:hypothetical protein
VSTRLEQHIQKLRLIWAAMLVSVGTYAIVGLVARTPAEAARPEDSVLVWVLGALAAAILLGVAPLHSAMLSRARRGCGDQQGLEPVLAGHLTALVVAWAQVETVAALGLVLLSLTARSDAFWTFLAVAVVGLLVLRPGTKDIDDLIKNAQSAAPSIDP